MSEFKCTGNMIVTDPCYSKPVEGEYSGNLTLRVKPGVWKTDMTFEEDEIVSSIVYHQDAEQDDLNWESKSYISVDSGMIGYFDEVFYPESDNEKKLNKFHEDCCELMHEKDSSIIKNIGFLTTTRDGDGSYEIFIAKDRHNNIIGITTLFTDE